MKAWMSSNFSKFATELLPLIDVRIEFLLAIYFVYTLSLTRSTFYRKSLFFCKLARELRPLIDVKIWFLLNILRTN